MVDLMLHYKIHFMMDLMLHMKVHFRAIKNG